MIPLFTRTTLSTTVQSSTNTINLNLFFIHKLSFFLNFLQGMGPLAHWIDNLLSGFSYIFAQN